jgi:hypothetical protein
VIGWYGLAVPPTVFSTDWNSADPSTTARRQGRAAPPGSFDVPTRRS